MDKITKAMCNQMHNQYYGVLKEEVEPVEGEQSDGKEVIPTSHDSVKRYIEEINPYMGNAHTSFDSIDYYPNLQKVQWTGEVASGVKWTALYSKEENGFYLNVENKKLSADETLAIHKLNTYFQTKWFSAIRKGLLNKEFD